MVRVVAHPCKLEEADGQKSFSASVYEFDFKSAPRVHLWMRGAFKGDARSSIRRSVTSSTRSSMVKTSASNASIQRSTRAPPLRARARFL